MWNFRSIADRPRLVAGCALGAWAAIELAILFLGPGVGEAREKIAAALAAGADPPWEAEADLGVRIAAWINLTFLVALGVTAGWWMRPFAAPAVQKTAAECGPRWFWPVVLVAVLMCLALRVPLASRSLWWDECWVLRQCSHGAWKPDKQDPQVLKFSPTTWKRCAFYYQKPTNHAPMSLAQKASLTAWRTATRAPAHEFNELAARVPALLASAAAVMLIACLLRSWGSPLAGVAAALLLAIHPWHIRYGVDARAYALVVPLCVSALFAASRILGSEGRKPWPWVWLGVNQALWLWAYPNGLMDLAAMGIVLGFLLWRKHADSGDRWTAMLRLGVAHLLAGMLFLQMFLPNLLQARHWAGQEADAHVLDGTLAVQTWQQLVMGTLPGQQSNAWSTPAILLATLLGLAGVTLLLNAKNSPGRLVAAPLAGAAGFALLTMLAGSYFYPRFVVALLPVFVIGYAWLVSGGDGNRLSFPRQAAIAVAGLLFFAVATAPASHVLLTTPYTPLRDVAWLPALAKTEPEPVVLCYGLGREALPTYYPRAIGVTSAEEIENQIKQARAQKRELYLVQGYNAFNRAMLPDGFLWIDDSRAFELIAEFPGIEPDFRFRVFKAVR